MKPYQLLGLLLCSFVFPNANAQSHRLHSKIAAYHAPMVFQKTGHDPRADAITRFDFDGDFVGNNNWKNLKKSRTPAAVYYDVRETKTHYYIMYAFFHPRDYSFICIPWVCHENDLEGAMLTIEKHNVEWQGRLVAIQTLAHDRIYTHEGIGGIRPVDETRGPASDTPNDIMNPRKTAVFIEWGGHGVYAYDPKEQKKLKEDKPTTLYTESQLLELANSNFTKNWLVYKYGATADDPEGANHGLYRYELLPIQDELWNRRDLIGKESVFSKLYNFKGTRYEIENLPATFSGEKYGSGRARPPWAWMDIFGTDEKRGEWFLDPAVFAARRLKKYQKEISLDYVHNPYLRKSL